MKKWVNKILALVSKVADFWYDFLTTTLKNFVLLVLMGSSYFLFFTIGKVNGFYTQQEQLVTLTGKKTVPELITMVDDGQLKGRLVIGEVTRFVDQYGNHWRVDQFEKNMSISSLEKLRQMGVDVSGKLRVDVQSDAVNAGQMTLNAFLDTAWRIGLALLYFGIVLLVFHHLKNSSSSMFGDVLKRYGKKNAPKISFKDVAGHHGPKREVQEVIEYLKNPDFFMRTGAKPPKGVLLYGPPGNGKTLIAKAVAGEAQANYFEQNASSFVQMYVGVGAQRVRQLFKEARAARPSVIFIDELDSVGQKRMGGGNDERLQTINALLAEMDGFENNEGIVVIAATNRLEHLDEALIRPGRFDRKVMVPLPHKVDRYEILDAIFKKLPLVNIDLERWSQKTQGFSGADLANLVNESAVEAARAKSDEVLDIHVAKARERILMGPENPTAVLSDGQKNTIAFHESGHVVVEWCLTKRVPEKVCIVPRGVRLGVTIMQVQEDLYLTPEDAEQKIKMLLAGRASEQLFVGQVSTASGDDLQKASEFARLLTLHLGQTDLGPYIPKSEHLLAENEKKAQGILERYYAEVLELLRNNEKIVKMIANQLIVEEQIEESSLQELLNEWRDKNG